MTDRLSRTELRLTSFSHGGGCGCKIAPGVLAEILKGSNRFPVPPELLVGIETADDAAVYQLNDQQALIATTDFFMPIVDDPGLLVACSADSVDEVLSTFRRDGFEQAAVIGELVDGPVQVRVA